MQDKGKGIAQLVGEHATETLIMGAGAHSGMAQLKSTSAKFVNQQADPSCYIWFICKRQLIYVITQHDRILLYVSPCSR